MTMITPMITPTTAMPTTAMPRPVMAADSDGSHTADTHVGDAGLTFHGDAELAPGLVDLAVNVRRPEPPPWLRDELARTLTSLAAYPDPAPATHAVAARHGRREDEVLLTAGAAEAFVLIARVLRPKCAVVVHPQFTEPEAALRAAGHRVRRVALSPADGFRLASASIPAEADLVIVGNPTNPTSVLHPAALLAGLARRGRVLVVDEAFMDAVPGEPESLAGASQLPGLLVIRSLTKTWGLAGLRIGYVLGAVGLLDRLRRAQPLWAVSTPALAAARACSSPRAVAEAEALARASEEDRAHLVGVLHPIPGVELAGSHRGPFLLIRVVDGLAVRDGLRRRGFAVRRGDTFPGLGPDWLRIAVRAAATSDAFADSLREVMSEVLT
jgi:histidinol-phosphate aminotransferase